MKKIPAVIERASDGTYSVYCKDEIFSGMGGSVGEAVQDMTRQMRAYRETAVKEGFRYPDFLDGEYEVEYSVDALSLMNYYLGKGWLTLSSLERITGIPQKQLWSYTHGTKPRKAQLERIMKGFSELSKDLDAVFA